MRAVAPYPSALTSVVSTTAMNDAAHDAARAYGRYMQGAAEIRRLKRLSNRAVLGGLVLMAVALLIRSWQIAPTRHSVVVDCTRQAGADASCISRSTMSSSTLAKNVPTKQSGD